MTINDYDDDDHGDDAEDDMSEFKLSCTMFVTPGAFKTGDVGGDGDEINQ